ncbi:MAG: 5'-nucleotidase C-terminal domain-containing protein [Salinimicrobium sp.]
MKSNFPKKGFFEAPVRVLRLIPFLMLLISFSCSTNDPATPPAKTFSLTALAKPEEGGQISPSEADYVAGELIELTAVPAKGWEFDGWDGDISGDENPIEVEAKKDMEVFALFKRQTESIVIFTINDLHGRINNFAKIKAIIDKEKETESQVFFVSGGDIFSGNPIVDYHSEKGFPIVDLMGKAGMDVSALGNHEFDYGQEILNNRMQQASFPFLCANVQLENGNLDIPQGEVNIEKDGFEIAFIGVVETGSPDNTPLSHPKKVKGLEFSEGLDAVGDYRNSETVKNADLVVALTHYGKYGDRKILEQHDFVDLVIGGHNHAIYDETVNGKHMIQSGSNLENMTRLRLSVQNGTIVDYDYKLIDLDESTLEDEELKSDIAEYNNKPEFFEEIGTSLQDHTSHETGCFYTDALRSITNADIVFQNYGGIRSGLDYGAITPFDIYTIDPFGNGLDSFNMSVGEIKAFLKASGANALAYSGLQLKRSGAEVYVYDASGDVMGDEEELVVALNDYISNVYQPFFGTPSKTWEKTTAEYLIDYLEQYQSVIDYDGCNTGI